MGTDITPLIGADVQERREAPLADVEFRDEDDKMVFEGHAAVFDSRSGDLGGFTEEIQRGAFRRALADDDDVRFLVNHDKNRLLARTSSGTMKLSEDPKGLHVRAELAPTSYAKDLRVLLERGDMREMSFGFKVGKGNDAWSEREGQVVRTVRSFERIFDVGPVTFPAYAETSASVRACGVELASADGEIDVERLRDLTFRIYRGDHEATEEERATIDGLLTKTDLVSPWMAERAARAYSQEPELRAALQGSGVRMVVEDPSSGQPAYRLAARQRRLRTLRAA
ncbi:MAG: HK97 family phage prohead protease [Actinomycetota bacterium]|nr:HK97 family phage prohead protease [Actinomycetota bacterium]